MTTPNVLPRILELLKRRGFLFPSAQIYGGLRGSFDLGPLGTELKRKISSAWWRDIVHSNPNIHGLDTSILTHHSILKASGHVDCFSDLLVDDRLSGTRFRADKAGPLEVLEDKGGEKYIPVVAADKASANEWNTLIKSVIAPGVRTEVKGKTVKVFVKDMIQPIVKEDTQEGLFERPGTLKLALESDEEGKTLDVLYCGYANPLNNSPFLTHPRPFNLLFKTFIDPIDPIEKIIQTTLSLAQSSSSTSTPSITQIRSTIEQVLRSSTAYLRPETAQGIYTSLPYLIKTLQLTPPFGIAQIGKSFRNEIRTESLLYRTFEFDQMELQYFVDPLSANDWSQYWIKKRFEWWKQHASNKSKWRLRPHEKKELAHYAESCTDIEFQFPWGWGELEGIANRRDFDLRQHEEAAGINMEVVERCVPENLGGGKSQMRSKRYVPYVVESSSGLSRAVLAYLCDAYTEETKPPLTSLPGSTINSTSSIQESACVAPSASRTFLRLHSRFAPVKVSILPLANKTPILSLTSQLHSQFLQSNLGMVTTDISGVSIGKKYWRADEIGVPVCVTVDYQSVEDGMVTVRERDTMKQKRVNVEEVADIVRDSVMS